MQLTEQVIKKLDPNQVYDSILAFPKQVIHAADEANKTKLPDDYRQIKNIVVAGMGGSALGARLIDYLEYDILQVPMEIVNDYSLASYVDKHTLVVASSYSGNTEEILACYRQAKNKGAKIVTISAGGTLAQQAITDGTPHIVFNPVFNPSQQPRLAIGYAIISLLALLAKLNLVKLSEAQVGRIARISEKQNRQYQLGHKSNETIELAKLLVGRIPILVASQHLYGATHTTKNQINENAKTFSAHFAIPELNHHLLEGLKFPPTNKSNLFFVFYASDFYHGRIQRRYRLTEKIVMKHQIPTYTYHATANTRIEQGFEVIQFGNFYSFYLAILNGINPTPIPTVDWFKQQMKRK
jgi:glucose/mannose-6-phosphate isomerase